MKQLDPETLQKVLESEPLLTAAAGPLLFEGLAIDSRQVRPGDIFFAIKGDKNDGHDFVANAFQRGAVAAVVDRDHLERFRSEKIGLVFAVEDTHDALLNLAGYLRRRSESRFAAITGSNGKTTTKEMLFSIVSLKHTVFRSPGNLNNLFGLPLSLGQMTDVGFAIFELGMSVLGEMSQLASIIKPELAVITNIGPAHLETLKTIENVIRAKFELVDRLPVGAAVVLNADDPYLMAEAERRRLKFIGFGIEQECEFRARNVRSESVGGLSFEISGQQLHLPLLGKINVYNAAAAVAAASVWGCEPQEWADGLATFQPVAMRLAMEEHDGLHLLVDCYNANPESTRAALRVLAETETPGRKIAVLGDMLELGETSPELHRQIGIEAARAGIDFLLCLGPQSKNTVQGAVAAGMASDRAYHFERHQELLSQLLDSVRRGDLVLFKGSRGMELEKIVVGLKGSAFKGN